MAFVVKINQGWVVHHLLRCVVRACSNFYLGAAPLLRTTIIRNRSCLRRFSNHGEHGVAQKTSKIPSVRSVNSVVNAVWLVLCFFVATSKLSCRRSEVLATFAALRILLFVLFCAFSWLLPTCPSPIGSLGDFRYIGNSLLSRIWLRPKLSEGCLMYFVYFVV